MVGRRYENRHLARIKFYHSSRILYSHEVFTIRLHLLTYQLIGQDFFEAVEGGDENSLHRLRTRCRASDLDMLAHQGENVVVYTEIFPVV